MRKIEITLSDETALVLEGIAARFDLTLEALLSRDDAWDVISLYLNAPKAWVPRPEWDALVEGVDCPLCAAIQSDEQINDFGCTVADLTLSRLRLAANQSVPGYSYLICSKHVCEPFELTVAERAQFFEDMMRAAQALWTVYRPIKMNYEILGNLVPHLHCHLKPRYYGDPAPGRPIHPDLNTIRLPPEQYREHADLIRSALTTSE